MIYMMLTASIVGEIVRSWSDHRTIRSPIQDPSELGYTRHSRTDREFNDRHSEQFTL